MNEHRDKQLAVAPKSTFRLDTVVALAADASKRIEVAKRHRFFADRLDAHPEDFDSDEEELAEDIARQRRTARQHEDEAADLLREALRTLDVPKQLDIFEEAFAGV